MCECFRDRVRDWRLKLSITLYIHTDCAGYAVGEVGTSGRLSLSIFGQAEMCLYSMRSD